jgi:hypothetical protein
MICPKCKAEYRDGFSVCSDCQVPLVWQLAPPQRSRASASDPPPFTIPEDRPPHDYSPDEDPFCALWHGEDSRIHAELCAVLQEAGIPYKTVRREDHLFRLNNISALKIGVPFSLYTKAELAVKEAFGTDDDGADAVPLLPAGSPENSGDVQNDSDDLPSPDFASRSPEDATAEVWSGTNYYFADFLVSCLQANGIYFHRDKTGTVHRLLVLPDDEERARKLIREVTEVSPPSG